MIEIPDVSLAIKWFLDEKDSEEALTILESILDSPENYVVPELFFYELNHVLNRTQGKVTSIQKKQIDLLLNLSWKRFSLTPDILKITHKFQGLGLSGYDSAYVALAEYINGVWITYDKEAHKISSKFNLSRLLLSI
jgi:predicted nucleic acid-binding protein